MEWLNKIKGKLFFNKDDIDYSSPYEVLKFIQFLKSYFKDKDVLKDGYGSYVIITKYDHIEEYLTLNLKILQNKNIKKIRSFILLDNHKENRIIDLLKDRDGYILENYNNYFYKLLSDLELLIEMYINSKDYYEICHLDIDSKIFYKYIIHMVYIMVDVYLCYNIKEG